MCQEHIFTKAWRIETSLGLIHVWMGEVVHQAKQTVEEILKTFLRGDGILSPQLILLHGSQSGCCYPPGCLQFQNLLFQFLPRHHHFPLLERLWTPVTEKVDFADVIRFMFLIIPAFFLRKKGYINFMSKSVRRPSVRLSVRPSVRASVRIIPAFFLRKKGYINFMSKSVRRPSVRLSVRPSVRPSVTFLVNVSPPKP